MSAEVTDPLALLAPERVELSRSRLVAGVDLPASIDAVLRTEHHRGIVATASVGSIRFVNISSGDAGAIVQPKHDDPDRPVTTFVWPTQSFALGLAAMVRIDPEAGDAVPGAAVPPSFDSLQHAQAAVASGTLGERAILHLVRWWDRSGGVVGAARLHVDGCSTWGRSDDDGPLALHAGDFLGLLQILLAGTVRA